MSKFIGVVLAATLAFAGAAGAAERGRDGQVNILFWQAPSNVNPYLSGGTKEIEVSSMVIQPLANYDPDGNMIPTLAAEIPTVGNGGVSADLMSITWKLKQGVTWSDGSAFTADDVVHTYEYCSHPDTGCSTMNYLAGISSVDAIDAHTVKITFAEPKPFPYSAFVGATTPIIQKAQFADCMGTKAQECTEANFYPIGTGPFVVKDFKPNDVVQLEANPNYREAGKPAFQSVLFKGGGDATSAARAVLETGEMDYAWNLQVEPEILAKMATAGKGVIVTAFGPSVERLMVNQTNNNAADPNRSEYMDGNNPHPFLSDYAVRRALS